MLFVFQRERELQVQDQNSFLLNMVMIANCKNHPRKMKILFTFSPQLLLTNPIEIWNFYHLKQAIIAFLLTLISQLLAHSIS